MRASVAKAFIPFSSGKLPGFPTNLEGVTNFLYLDVGDKTDPSVPGKVHAGVGDLLDPIELALPLPWLNNADNSSASQDTIRAQWQLVKSRQDLKSKGGMAYQGLTSIHLSPDGIKDLSASKLAQNETYILQTFPAYPSWPADGQLGILSLAWGRGPSFPGSGKNAFPKLTAALQKTPPDFLTASVESSMYNGAPARNAANATLFANADAVQKAGSDPDVLWFPSTPGGSVPPSYQPPSQPTSPTGTVPNQPIARVVPPSGIPGAIGTLKGPLPVSGVSAETALATVGLGLLGGGVAGPIGAIIGGILGYLWSTP
jgi:hypothetical protein